MTTQPGPVIPEFTMADRLRKARDLTGMNTRDFADLIGVAPKTVNNAETGRTAVRKIVLNAWSLATGVPVQWLETGIAPTEDDGGDGAGAEDGTRTRNILLGMPTLHEADVVTLPTAA